MKNYLLTLLLALCLSVPAFAEGNYIRGDVNGDGVVSTADISALIDYLLSGAAVNTRNADTNNDGTVTPADISDLMNYLLNGTWSGGDEPQGEVFTVNGVPFTMIPVEGGTFMMGGTEEQGTDARDNEYPVHQVTLSSYSIGMTQVTQELWVAVMGSNPSYFNGGSFGTNLKRPVEMVSWEDCQTFIARLNELTGKNFRLPTEAEWEYAARGGNKSQGYTYSGSNAIDEVAWYLENSGLSTHSVATKAPNELGLYDMSGNVYEWCQDWTGSYSSEAQTNPTGPETGSYRVLRGGHWASLALSNLRSSCCRVSYRDCSTPSGGISLLGLRLAL